MALTTGLISLPLDPHFSPPSHFYLLFLLFYITLVSLSVFLAVKSFFTMNLEVLSSASCGWIILEATVRDGPKARKRRINSRTLEHQENSWLSTSFSFTFLSSTADHQVLALKELQQVVPKQGHWYMKHFRLGDSSLIEVRAYWGR